MIKKLLENPNTKKLIYNFLSLSILQGVNYILPFITFPYLVRVLGIEYFGLLAFSTSTIMYFNILVDYGFNLTATKEIAIYRTDKNKITEIFSNVMITKFVLILISFFILTTLILSINKIHEYWYIFYLTFGLVIGQNLLPLWFFQGLEEMKYITILNIIAKGFFTLMVFLLIHSENQFYIVPILNALGYIFVGVFSLIYINKKFGVKIHFYGIKKIIEYLINNFQFFISNIGITFYSISTTFLLGLFTNNLVVGNYALVEKIILALRQLYSPLNQSIYPYFMKKFHKNKKQAFGNLNKIAFIGSLIIFFSLFSISFFEKELIVFVFGENTYNNEVSHFFKILIYIPLFTYLGSLYLMNAMIALNLNALRNKIIFSIGIIYIISITLVIKINYMVFPYIYFIAESLISFFAFYFSYRYIKNNA